MKLPAARLSSTTQKYLNPGLTLALVQGAVAAYADYVGKPYVWPEGYNLVARWTGWDGFFGYGQEEKFGLAFQSQADPTTMILAFRGTDSDWDVLENRV